MAYTQVGIVNLALIRCKSTTISSMSEASVMARTASAVWDYIRDEVFAAFPWNFTKTRAELAQDTGTPEYGYDYQYTKPSGCLRILEVVQADEKIAYVEEGDYILTDYDNDDDEIYILYTAVETDYTKWPPSFVNAFAYRLAAELGAKLESVDVNDMLNKYQIALNDAKASNQSKDYIEDDPAGSTSWEDAGR